MQETDSLRAGLNSISKQIREFRSELKVELGTFKDELKTQMKHELEQFKEDINQKITLTTQEIKEQNAKVETTLSRVEEMECWSSETDGQEFMQEHKKMIDKLTDLESRSRRKNLRIFGVPEDEEKGSVTQFVEELMRRELGIDADCQIQRAHRALAPKPKADRPPRAIVVNFLQYSTKEMVLSKAWSKRIITIGERRIFFDHDYPLAMVQQRKSYVKAKKILKEAGIRFQTPFTKMRVHWNNGVKTYNDAKEVEKDLRDRGYKVADSEEAEGTITLLERLEARKSSAWQRVTKERREEASRRVRKRLEDFRRKNAVNL
ncbi:hypothetical protein M9458_053021 [Cirrhinus mrigala]|uniref:L1 transposable element RRM domain-containing protein n=1 Tax=Cirrhinus mrigala TaxID=683832 RepID=A0ABD0MRJ5_CIRMR